MKAAVALCREGPIWVRSASRHAEDNVSHQSDACSLHALVGAGSFDIAPVADARFELASLPSARPGARLLANDPADLARSAGTDSARPLRHSSRRLAGSSSSRARSQRRAISSGVSNIACYS